MTETGKHGLDNAGSPGSVVWLISHGPLGYCLLCVGTGIKFMMFVVEEGDEYEYGDEGTDFAQSQISMALIGCVLSIFLIRTAHLNFYWLLWPSSIVRPLT